MSKDLADFDIVFGAAIGGSDASLAAAARDPQAHLDPSQAYKVAQLARVLIHFIAFLQALGADDALATDRAAIPVQQAESQLPPHLVGRDQGVLRLQLMLAMYDQPTSVRISEYLEAQARRSPELPA
jgi:hypothetical protein